MAKVRVFSVNGIRLDLLKSNPPQLFVSVSGFTATSGWTDLALVPMEKKVSADGILDLEAVGEAPGGIVLQVLTPVTINLVVTDEVEKIVGVKVHARSNDLTQLIGADDGRGMAPSLPPFTTLAVGEEGSPITTLALGEESPWPFPTSFGIGEEGPMPKPHFGETDPRLDDPRSPFANHPLFQMGFQSPFGRR